MDDYRPSGIGDMILCFGECHKKYRRGVAMYRRRYPKKLHPSTSCLWKIVRRARLRELKRTRRFLNRVDEENPRLLAILGMIHLNPHYSLWDIQRDLGVPRSTVQRLPKSVKYHPYNITLNHALTEEDKRHRRQVFPQRWIGRGGSIKWPARSPDLTSPDLFLWGYIKNRVYYNQPTTQPVLLASIQNFQNRLQLCIQANRGTFEHLL